MRYTFYSSDNDGRAPHKRTDDSFDEYGAAVNASIETPFGYWGGTR
jgi:hypothetical protein